MAVLLLMATFGIQAADDQSAAARFLRAQLPGNLPMAQGRNHYEDGFPRAAYEEWIEAAKWGHAEAQMLIGMMHLHGDGVEPDASTAHAWLVLASSHNDAKAISMRDKVWSLLSPAQRRRAAETFQTLDGDYGPQAVMDRILTWYRKEFHRSRRQEPRMVIIPNDALPIFIPRYRDRLEQVLMYDYMPNYAIQYRDFQVLENEERGESKDGADDEKD